MDSSHLKNYRCGYVALLGRPNVGKSTLLNQILQFKLSIVTPKPQTTRNRILGIYNDEESQILFLDTPGFIEPKYQLQKYLLRAAESAARDADIRVYMVAAAEELLAIDQQIIEKLSGHRGSLMICINKIDLIAKNLLLPVIQKLSQNKNIKEIVPISALKKDGIDELLAVIKSYLPVGPPLYPSDQLTTANERFLVSEIIREKIFLLYRDEIPYSTAVFIEEFKERPGKKDYIRAVVLVERDQQKSILIGKRGEALKRVGELARREIEVLLHRPVFLELVVMTRPKWRQKEQMLLSLGYSRTS